MTRTALISIIKIIYNGSKIFVKSLQKSLAEEIEQSNRIAEIRYKEKAKERSRKDAMSLEEAMKVLNCSELNKGKIDTNFKYLYSANQKENGGTFYLLSKVVRAKERIDLEMCGRENKNSNQ